MTNKIKKLCKIPGSVPIFRSLFPVDKICLPIFRKYNVPQVWYQSVSAFYFLVDFSQFPIMKHFKENSEDYTDYATQICDEILTESGVALVPTTDFGISNAGRISMVLEAEPFTEAITALLEFLVRD